ncbi:hypothetical protein C8A01DRAFT_21612, partial [Parachaetomium inaequale]
WIQIIMAGVSKQVIRLSYLLYYASSFGYIGLVDTIIRFDDIVDLEAPGSRTGSTAL